MADFWNSYEVIREVGKNDKGDVIRVALATKGNKTYVDVRTFYVDKNDGELKPGKGISIPDDLADEVAEAIIESGSNGYEEDEDND